MRWLESMVDTMEVSAATMMAYMKPPSASNTMMNARSLSQKPEISPNPTDVITVIQK